MVRQHKINPRGLAVYVDELIGFIKCFNKYRSGNDEQIWTQLYNGGSVIVNRVSSQPLNIEDTCIGVIGTIQPGLLYEFAKGKTESGFVDRWLFAYPDDSAYPKMNQEQLPITFTTAEGLEIARDYAVSERTFKEWLKSNFFRHISRRQIGTVLVGETIRRNDTLTNPADGESHCIRYCDIRAVYDEFDRHYYLTIDGHSVADFFANVTAKENILMETDMDSAFGRVWERGL